MGFDEANLMEIYLQENEENIKAWLSFIIKSRLDKEIDDLDYRALNNVMVRCTNYEIVQDYCSNVLSVKKKLSVFI